MAGLPPRPDDVLPPCPPRRATSPRAASMRNDPVLRERDREDRRRRSSDSRRFSPPRPDGWRRPPRDDDRYQDQTSRSARERDERDRERPRARVGKDRIAMDTYVPGSRPSPRHRSPVRHRLSRSRSPRNRTVRSPSPTRPGLSPRNARSRSPRSFRRSPPPRKHSARSQSSHRPAGSPVDSRKAPSREKRRHWSERGLSPRPDSRRRSPDQSQPENPTDDQSLHSKSRTSSEIHDEDAEPARHRDISPDAVTSTEPQAGMRNQEVEKQFSLTGLSKETEISPVKRLPTHPPPSGPRRPRTPTGPRARSPVPRRRDNFDDFALRREDKGKGKEILRNEGLNEDNRPCERSLSPPHEPLKRVRRSWSSSRSSSHPPRSTSPRSPSLSPTRSHSHYTASEKASSHAPKKDLSDKNGRKPLNIDDLIPALKPRVSKTAAQDADLKRIREQRAKLEPEHANVMRAVRRAQHELDVAILELRSAEERRKAAQRVHERTVKGFFAPVI